MWCLSIHMQLGFIRPLDASGVNDVLQVLLWPTCCLGCGSQILWLLCWSGPSQQWWGSSLLQGPLSVGSWPVFLTPWIYEGSEVHPSDGKENGCLGTLLSGSVFKSPAGSASALKYLWKFGFFSIKITLGLKGPFLFCALHWCPCSSLMMWQCTARHHQA